MENKSLIKKSADARIVQAVRRLKSTRQKGDTSEVRKNQEDIKQPKILNSKLGYLNDNNNIKGRNTKNSSNLALINPLTKKGSIVNNDSINNNHKSIRTHKFICNNVFIFKDTKIISSFNSINRNTNFNHLISKLLFI